MTKIDNAHKATLDKQWYTPGVLPAPSKPTLTKAAPSRGKSAVAIRKAKG